MKLSDISALVRPIMAVSLTAATIGLTYLKTLPPEILGTLTVTVVAFYFGERSALKTPRPIPPQRAGHDD